jgi:hypothetical protein
LEIFSFALIGVHHLVITLESKKPSKAHATSPNNLKYGVHMCLFKKIQTTKNIRIRSREIKETHKRLGSFY